MQSELRLNTSLLDVDKRRHGKNITLRALNIVSYRACESPFSIQRSML